MKATFIGDPRNPGEQVPNTHEAYGITFERGLATDIPKELEAKFAGNSHYEVSGAASTDASELGPLDQSVVKLKGHLEGMDDATELQKLRDQEVAGKSRQSALDAIDDRLKALEA